MSSCSLVAAAVERSSQLKTYIQAAFAVCLLVDVASTEGTRFQGPGIANTASELLRVTDSASADWPVLRAACMACPASTVVRPTNGTACDCVTPLLIQLKLRSATLSAFTPADEAAFLANLAATLGVQPQQVGLLALVWNKGRLSWDGLELILCVKPKCNKN